MVFGGLVDFPPTFPQAVDNCVEKAKFYTGPWEKLCRFSRKCPQIRIFSSGSPEKALFICGKPKFNSVWKKMFQKVFHIPLWRAVPAFPTKKCRKISTTTAFVALASLQTPFLPFFLVQMPLFRNISTRNPVINNRKIVVAN